MELVDKEDITEEKRSDRVIDFNYGDVESHELGHLDKPVLAKIKYAGKILIFEDYEALDDFIIHEFVPDHVRMKVVKSTNSKAANLNKPYPSIQLNEIVDLRLSEREVKHVVELLYKHGIRIGGTSQDMDSEFVNYDYIRTYASKKYAKPMSREEEHEKFMEYQKTHDPVLREELIIRNLRLVPYIAWRLALRHGVNKEELESYGYEGLIYAIEGYDPTMECRFATYAIPTISGYIKGAIPDIKDVNEELYYAFQNVRYIIEKEWGKKYDGDPEMLKEIIDVMVLEGMIRENERKIVWERFSKRESYEELREAEDETGIIDDEAKEELDYKVFTSTLKDLIPEFLEALTPKEAEVIRLRFGLDDGVQHTLEEVAKHFNVTKERIRQVEAKALRKLRRPSNSQKVRDYIYEDEEKIETSEGGYGF